MKMATQVYIIDDDASVRRSLVRLLRITGYRVEAFSSAAEFLETDPVARHACIVLDLRMPGLSGEDLQDMLRARREAPPIIVITGHGDLRVKASMLEKGAVAFLLKPFDDQELLDAIEVALARNSRKAPEARES